MVDWLISIYQLMMSTEPRDATKPLPRMPGTSSKLTSSKTSDSPSGLKAYNISLQTTCGAKSPYLKTNNERFLQDGLHPDMEYRKVPTLGQEKESGRVQLPALNVVTSFPKPLNNMSSLSHQPVPQRQKSLRARRTQARKQKGHEGEEGPVGSLQRFNSRRSELSPSDRNLVIGISIPSYKPSNTGRGSTRTGQQQDNLAVPMDDENKQPQSTPEIVITPAQTRDPWLSASRQEKARGRRRAPSSFYSQITPFAPQPAQPSEMPPLPQRAPSNPSNDIRQDSNINDSRSRVTSWATDIDDEATDAVSEYRRHSNESQLVILRRSSLDTLATRHRSRGWWNQILSPFLERSATDIPKQSPTDSLKQPSLPNNTSQNVAGTKDILATNGTHTNIAEEQASPYRSSTWTDASQWEAERRTMLLNNEQARRGIMGNTTGADQGHQQVLSPDFVDPAGFGAAAEYFEASWHDQNSPTPFFRCHNHDCSMNHDVAPAILGTETNSREPIKPPTVKQGEEASAFGTFYQTPANRFSAAFSQSKGLKTRPLSDGTIFEEEITPQIKEAKAAPILRAGLPIPAAASSQISQSLAKGHQVQPTSTAVYLDDSSVNLVSKLPRYAESSSAISENEPAKTAADIEVSRVTIEPIEEAVLSKPVRPPLQSRMHAREDVTITSLTNGTVPQQPQNIYHVNQYFRHSGSKASSERIHLVQFDPSPPQTWNESSRHHYGNEKSRSAHNPKKKRFSCMGCFTRAKPKNKKKRRCLYAGIALALLAMIALTVALAMILPRKPADMPVQPSWLNITGYPPIPTGIATIARPDAAVVNPGCVHPSTMWSCSVPKEQQSLMAPNDPDQPNFMVEIRFRNGTGSGNSTSKQRRSQSAVGNTVSAGAFVRRHLLRNRDPFTDALYTPNPSPPSQEDQGFLGNTTDKNLAPFNGEATPFFISFLDATPPAAQLSRRQPQNSNNPFPDILGTIPPPSLNPNGTAAPANLLPLLSVQPLRLYNRGSHDEHYGFYSYFDRSIFLKSTALLDAAASLSGEVPDDRNGGSEESAATVRCTWTQTRFVVQVWTNRAKTASLLQGPHPTSTAPSQPSQTSNPSNSSATDFLRPGSFPYPVTIKLDRHGGDITKKMIYCYGLDKSEHIIPDAKKIQLEDRAFGGALVNPALGVFGNVNTSLAQGGPGGIDGGVGGCGCEWRNWEGT